MIVFTGDKEMDKSHQLMLPSKIWKNKNFIYFGQIHLVVPEWSNIRNIVATNQHKNQMWSSSFVLYQHIKMSGGKNAIIKWFIYLIYFNTLLILLFKLDGFGKKCAALQRDLTGLKLAQVRNHFMKYIF